MKPFFIQIILCLFCFSETSQAVESQLMLDPTKPNELTAVELSFRYRSVLPDEKFKYVFEGGSDLLTPDSEEDYLIIGTLRPCVGVVFNNQSNGFQLGFHHHYKNSFESMRGIYNEYLQVEDPSRVLVQIYSFKMDETQYIRDFYSPTGPRSQLEEMVDLKQFMISELGIPEENIQLTLGESDIDEVELGSYRNANLSILVDKGGEIFCTCLLAEDLMDLKGTSILFENALSAGIRNNTKRLYGENHTGQIPLMEPNGAFRGILDVKNGKVPFDSLEIAEKHNAALAKMQRLEKICFNKAFPENPILTLARGSRTKDELNQKIHRRVEFYFIPQLKLNLNKRSSPS